MMKILQHDIRIKLVELGLTDVMFSFESDPYQPIYKFCIITTNPLHPFKNRIIYKFENIINNNSIRMAEIETMAYRAYDEFLHIKSISLLERLLGDNK